MTVSKAHYDGEEFYVQPSMEPHPGRSTVKFFESKWREHERKFPDAEEIRAISRQYKREYWEPDRPETLKLRWARPVDYRRAIIRDFLEYFGSVKLGELKRFGITPCLVGRTLADMPNVKREQVSCRDGGYVFYVLQR